MLLLFFGVHWDICFEKKMALILLTKNEWCSVSMYLTVSYVIQNESVKKRDSFYSGKHGAKKEYSSPNLFLITLNSLV